MTKGNIKQVSAKKFIDFVCKQELDLEQYPFILLKRIKEKYRVSQKGLKGSAPAFIVQAIIDWENHKFHNSVTLEGLIEEKFDIYEKP